MKKMVYNIRASGEKWLTIGKSTQKWSENPTLDPKIRKKGETFMFAGEYYHAKDSKNRVFIPAKFREALGETFVIAKDIRRKCLKVCSLADWEAYVAPIKEKGKTSVADLMRFFHSSMAEVTPDAQGRVVLPQELVNHSEIVRNLVVVGCGEYGEIWSEDNYAAIKAENTPENMFELLKELGFV